MSDKIKRVIEGLLFGLVGAGIGYLVSKKRYNARMEEELASVKEVFEKAIPKPKPEETPVDQIAEVAKYTVDLGYSEEAKPKTPQKPHVISPDAFGEQDGYDEISLTYYADGTLTDDTDHAMSEDEIEETVGHESLKKFGEHEEDSVFVRNDRLKCDYEILLDQRTYADVLREKPYLAE